MRFGYHLDGPTVIITVIVCLLFGLIPAFIARYKGYSFKFFWIYGAILFMVALIHSCCLRNKNVKHVMNAESEEILKKYKAMLDAGTISKEDYELEKQQLLSK